MSGQKIGIVGSGLIGRAWAMLFAGAGYRVQLYDILETQVATALVELQKDLRSLEEKGRLRGQLSAVEQFELISGCTKLEQLVQGAVHVQECVPEQLALKRSLYAQLDELLEPQTVVASSTSTFMPSLYSEGLKHREQVNSFELESFPMLISVSISADARGTSAESTLLHTACGAGAGTLDQGGACGTHSPADAVPGPASGGAQAGGAGLCHKSHTVRHPQRGVAPGGRRHH